ncbi:hypothetical protein Mtc_0747 [Methanocella conradii HZ254]|uniref:Uncharacterized protein n=1 Tax=Methanocella conradii (strain DSM 24694 / JCM 17849 / CGMCC 1.5162 / HZ254) TaxID=1041930 RepID=H8I993_METCZ|nr:hypothetical protein Mtc_0747 [Methanocella conradii HZ254]
MKIKGILTLASVAILVATGGGNAFAYTWPGTPSYQAETSSGTHYFMIRDYYGYSYAGSDFSVQNNQYYSV